MFKTAAGNAITACLGTVPGYWFTVAFVDTIGRVPIQFMGVHLASSCITRLFTRMFPIVIAAVLDPVSLDRPAAKKTGWQLLALLRAPDVSDFLYLLASGVWSEHKTHA